MDALTMERPERCVLQHAFFSSAGDIRFRLSPVDGVATMARALGDREASIPLRSLQRELAIAEDTADGRMFDLIGEALDFVPFLQPGDRLPSEVRTGEASWEPEPDHVKLSAVRLRLRLVAWLSAPGRWSEHPTDDASLAALVDDDTLREAVGTLAAQAARDLKLPGASTVTRLLDELAQELAYIDTLRARLLWRVEKMVVLVGQRARSRREGAGVFDTVNQVHRLAQISYKQLRSRFEDVDTQTAEIAVLLGNADAQRVFIRSNRDWLYRSQRAWEPVLTQWERAEETSEAGITALLSRTYQYLAPRFMPTTEWQAHRYARVRDPSIPRMTW